MVSSKASWAKISLEIPSRRDDIRNDTRYPTDRSDAEILELLEFVRDNRDERGRIQWSKWPVPDERTMIESLYWRIRRYYQRQGIKTLEGVLALYLDDDEVPPDEDPDLATLGDRLEITTDKSEIPMTEEEVMAAHGLDPEEWVIERFSPNHWTGAGPFGKEAHSRVRASFIRRVDAGLVEAADELIEQMKEHAPAYPRRAPFRPSGNGQRNLLEVCLFDAHVGMLGWAREVGSNYDVNIAQSLFLWATETLLDRASAFPVEKIIFPVGQDFFHTDQTVDGKAGATTAGTLQDTDGRWQMSFDKGMSLLISAIDLMQEVAPVQCVYVPGNHDTQTSYHAARMLWAWYANCDRVTVDCNPNPRKYFRYGTTLLGFSHGRDEKVKELPLIMASEAPDAWAQTEYREFHIGHYHRKREYHHAPASEHNGVRVRVIPSLTDADSWHHEKGYTRGRRASEAYLHHFEEGPVASFSANIHPGMFEAGELVADYERSVCDLDNLTPEITTGPLEVPSL